MHGETVKFITVCFKYFSFFFSRHVPWRAEIQKAQKKTGK